MITVEELATYLSLQVKAATDQHQNPLSGDLVPGGSKGGFFFLNRARQLSAGTVSPWDPKKAMPSGNDQADIMADALEFARNDYFVTARKLYRQLAEKGNAEAMFYLGLLSDPYVKITTLKGPHKWDVSDK